MATVADNDSIKSRAYGNPQLADFSRVPKHPDKVWLFAALPDHWDLKEKLQNARDHTSEWLIPKNKLGKDIEIGNTVVLWQYGENNGTYGIAEISGDPVLDNEDGFWHVPLRYVYALPTPIWCKDIETHPILSQMSVVPRSYGGTKFRVTAEQWASVYELMRKACGGETEDEIEDFKKMAAVVSGKRSVRGFQTDVKRRRAVELHAMKMAIEHYKSEGWTVRNVSETESFDLQCTRADAAELRVEVKGTTSAGSKVLLTRNEVENARTYPLVALYIVANIEVVESAAGPEASGGTVILIAPWHPEDVDLEPLQYSYAVSTTIE